MHFRQMLGHVNHKTSDALLFGQRPTVAKFTKLVINIFINLKVCSALWQLVDMHLVDSIYSSRCTNEAVCPLRNARRDVWRINDY